MNYVYYFSGTGHSFAIARLVSRELGIKAVDIGRALTEKELICNTAVIVFPVYAQGVPKPVRRFLKAVSAEDVALIATYGRISYGNALYEAKRLISGRVIAGAYVPIGHTFLNGDFAFDAGALSPILERIKNPSEAKIPKERKDVFASFFPNLRARIGVKIVKGRGCNSCGSCEKSCPMGAIKNGKSGFKCIRCLKCVLLCPQGALRAESSAVLNRYLKTHFKNEIKIYL